MKVADLVPHSGAMCLLDEVSQWSLEQIQCRADVRTPHPLAIGPRLPATALIEYAAQAMAAHGQLLARQGGDSATPGQGMLAAIRATDLHCRWVTVTQLAVMARQLSSDSNQMLYAFEVSARGAGNQQGQLLASGRALVLRQRSQPCGAQSKPVAAR